MRWFDVGEEAYGVVAIGQFARGVFAFGQVSHGFVAVGQVAFGVVAIGQVAVGAFTFGMVGVGLNTTIAMLGVGGRGRGIVLPLLPNLGHRRAPPAAVSMAEVRRSGPGWVRLHFEPRDDGRIAVYEGVERVRDVRIDARVRRAAVGVAPGEVWALLRSSPDGWVAERLMRVDAPRWEDPKWWPIWAAQLAGLAAVAGVVWWAVGLPVLDTWFGTEGILLP